MPIYEYRACQDCGQHFETFVRSDTQPESDLPFDRWRSSSRSSQRASPRPKRCRCRRARAPDAVTPTARAPARCA
ncbi:MAG: zinc ribbon domain-containing protein [Comamonadaceae bacterium]|nr:zinc ribbon domain-containing protein [Comamonadaceae bacterium]